MVAKEITFTSKVFLIKKIPTGEIKHIMDLNGFISGLKYTEPDELKIKKLEMVQNQKQPINVNSELYRLSFAHNAFQNYYIKNLIPKINICKYKNYPLSSIINFCSHQLSMRRFDCAGSQKLIQIGGYSGEEFLVGVAKTVGIECHLVGISNNYIFDNIQGILKAEPWESRITKYEIHPADYIEKYRFNIGGAIISNMKDIQTYEAMIDVIWGSLDSHSSIIISGNINVIMGLREKMINKSISCSDLFIRENSSHEFLDSCIVVINKLVFDYSALTPQGYR